MWIHIFQEQSRLHSKHFLVFVNEDVGIISQLNSYHIQYLPHISNQ